MRRFLRSLLSLLPSVRSARLSSLSRTATARVRAVHASAAGFLPRAYRLSRIMGAEGASGVRWADGRPVDASPRKFRRASPVASRPVASLPGRSADVRTLAGYVL